MTFRIFILVFTWTVATAQTTTIKGYIHDRKHNEPIPFCNITIQELKTSATSDLNGHFVFNNVPFGTYKIKAIYVGMGDTTVQVKIVDETTFELKMELPPPCKYDKNLNDKTCPVCNKRDMTIPIVYGLIVSEEGSKSDKEMYDKWYPGGCVISKCDPNWYCKRDKYKF